MARRDGDVSGHLRRRSLVFPSQFWLLIGGTFLYLSGYDLCYPFETLYLHNRLGVSMTAVGLIIGLPTLAGLPVQIAGGAIADRFGRRVLLIVGGCASIVLFWGLAAAGSLWLVVLVISIEAAFGWAMYFTANNAMLADLTAPAQRDEGYSISRVAANAGQAAGPLAAGLLLALAFSYRSLFIAGGTICGLFLVLVLAVIRESRPAVEERHELRPATLAGYRLVLADRTFLALCAIALLPLYGYGQILVTLPVLLHNGVGIAASSWGLLAALYAGCGLVLQYPLVQRLRSHDKLGLLAVGSGLVGVGMAGAAFAPRGIGTAAAVVLVAVGTMLFAPIAPAVVSAMAPPDLRGRYMGVWTLVWLGGTALGPTFGGPAMDALGGRGAYLLLLAAACLGAVLFLILGRELRLRMGASTVQADQLDLHSRP